MQHKNFLWLFVGLVALIELQSCAASKPRIPTLQFTQYGLTEGAGQPQAQSDITISLKVIRTADIYQYPDLFSFNVESMTQDRDAQYTLKGMYPVGPNGRSWENPFTTPDGKVSLLLCWAKIVNNTKHILRMKDARVYLILGGQDPLPAYVSMEDLLKAVDVFEEKANEHLAAQYQKSLIRIGDMPQLPRGFYRALVRSHERAYKLINDVSKEILPGFTYEGFLVFPVAPEIQGAATLSFFDITTKTDAAGNPVEKARFDFPLEQQAVSMWYDGQEKMWKSGTPPAQP